MMQVSLEQRFSDKLKRYCGNSIEQASDAELCFALSGLVKDEVRTLPRMTGSKKVYYLSSEFYPGKNLSDCLLKLSLYDELEKVLSKHGKNLAAILEQEPEPALGNGGLGRLASCYVDAAAGLGIPLEGMGLLYHFGIFRQAVDDFLMQSEKPDRWLDGATQLKKRPVSFEVPFGNGWKARALLYDIDLPGNESGYVPLHLFDVESVDESLIHDDIRFDKKAVEKNLTLLLYPDESDGGYELRIYQQYFLCSSAAQYILWEQEQMGHDLHELDQHVAIQINDTHPTMVIPELIRLLWLEHGFTLDDAVSVVSKLCAYTNHTLLREALEVRPLHLVEKIAPQIVPVIRELQNRVAKTTKDPAVQIIDNKGNLHTANLCCHYCFSINGVAELHTNLLKDTELKEFYGLYPEKFKNITNGVTFNRWLQVCNRPLANFLDERIGPDYRKDTARLEDLLQYKDDPAVLERLDTIKRNNKQRLADYIRDREGVILNPDSVFDVQIKRFHKYKRQDMLALQLIQTYQEIKQGIHPPRPITCIVGGKAHPSYEAAKDTIHLLLVLQQIINRDPDVNEWLNVVMVTNYNVTYAEQIIPACDISEQISLAGQEASGTSNMKLMLNGAVTLGTDDGANVEIHSLVGDDNIYILGMDVATVLEKTAATGEQAYHPTAYYQESEVLRSAIDFITSKQALALGDLGALRRLSDYLRTDDAYMVLADFESYTTTKKKMLTDYENRNSWNQKSLVNIAKAGFFSAERAILEYNQKIWNVQTGI